MLSGFKEFLMRGNVVELAVAVVVGSAFTAIVTAFTDKIVNPLVAALGGSPEFGLGFHIREGNPATFVDFGAVITALEHRIYEIEHITPCVGILLRDGGIGCF